jgi:hypothetical protein
MTLFDQMDKRPGTVMFVLAALGALGYVGMFIGALLIIKHIFF